MVYAHIPILPRFRLFRRLLKREYRRKEKNVGTLKKIMGRSGLVYGEWTLEECMEVYIDGIVKCVSY